MRVILNKNIKYNGQPCKIGDIILIDKAELSEFIRKKIIDGDILKTMQELDKAEEVEESDTTEQRITNYDNGTSIIGIDDITKAEISDILTIRGIEHNNRDRKELLYELALGSE